MEKYQNMKRSDLGDGCVVCEDVRLASKSICSVYFSPRSIYVISSGHSAPEKRYREIQDLLGAVRIRLYLLDSGDGTAGLYDPLSNSLSGELDSEALSEDVVSWMQSGRIIYSPSAIDRMISLLQNADIYSRGYAVQEDGEILLLRHGRFHPTASVSSDTMYCLTLFTGVLGLHRFVSGKIFSGLLYLLTGGMFLSGWFLDILQLFIGGQKDGKKCYFLPLTKRKSKLLMFPLGFITSLALFKIYLFLAQACGLGFLNSLAMKLSDTDPHFFEDLGKSIADFVSRLT